MSIILGFVWTSFGGFSSSVSRVTYGDVIILPILLEPGATRAQMLSSLSGWLFGFSCGSLF